MRWRWPSREISAEPAITVTITITP